LTGKLTQKEKSKTTHMQKFEPVGRKMLVVPLKEENYKTSLGIELIQLEFIKVKVVEVSNEYKNMYIPGDVIVISANAGIGQPYNGESCLWIDAKAAPEGDVWFIVREDEVEEEFNEQISDISI
jgi:hypothetical protein